MGKLQEIPGVGKNIEQDLINIGIREISDLKGKKPEELYLQDCLYKGFQEDKCQLYVFRLAVYFAEHETHEAEKLKWHSHNGSFSFPRPAPEVHTRLFYQRGFLEQLLQKALFFL